MDVLLSLLALVLFSPVMFAAALAVRLRLGSPTIFKQIRPGRSGIYFSLFKFRTMSDAHDDDGRLLPEELRLIRFGSLLRSLSLDELPQLWNVLRGDLSLVGPRPQLVEYLDRYTPEQARRHLVKPGITGFAQVNGRNAIGWDEKFALDLWYVEHCSLSLDLRILLMTLVQVVKRDGISSAAHVTMPVFMGSVSKEPQPK